MVYSEVIFNLSTTEEFHKDLLINSLSEIGFDTFEDFDAGFKAYIPSSEFNADVIEQLMVVYGDMFSFTFAAKRIPHQNWNEIWESNFEPLQVADRCYIRATFHEPHPDSYRPEDGFWDWPSSNYCPDDGIHAWRKLQRTERFGYGMRYWNSCNTGFKNGRKRSFSY
jgi:hypothetical protein